MFYAGCTQACLVPTSEGDTQLTTIWNSFDYGLVEGDVRRLHGKIGKYESEIGCDTIDPTTFVPNPECPGSQR